MLVVGCVLCVAFCLLLRFVLRCRSLIVILFVVCCSLLIARCLWFGVCLVVVACCVLFVGWRVFFVVRCLRFVVCCLLHVRCCLSFVCCVGLLVFDLRVCALFNVYCVLCGVVVCCGLSFCSFVVRLLLLCVVVCCSLNGISC